MRKTDRQVYATDLVLLYPPGPFQELGATGGRIGTGEPLDNELGHLLPERQRDQCIVDPRPSFSVERL
jgi:hypothetical protein